MDWWHNSIISVEHSFSTTMMPFPIKRHTMIMSFVHQVCVVPNSNQPYGLIFEWPGWNPELNLDPWKGCIWFRILFFQGGGVKVWLGVMLWRILSFSKNRPGFPFPFPKFCRFSFLEIFSACANSQTLGDFAEPILVLEFEIPQKIPSLSHKFQQTTPGMKIFGLFPEMIGEVVDPFCQ